MTQYGPVDILFAEDDESQRESIVDTLENTIPDIVVMAVGDGLKAVDFLFGQGTWTNRVSKEPPRLILLDLTMPEMGGFAVLEQIRKLDSEDALRMTPVVIFTDSLVTGDISKSYHSGANSFITKPLSLHEFQDAVATVGKYWINYNKVPA